MENKKPSIFAVLAAFAVSCVFSGWILQTMWAWFVVPLGVSPLSLAHAVGLDSLLTIYWYGSAKASKNSEEFWSNVCKAVSAHLILLLVGFVAHLVM